MRDYSLQVVSHLPEAKGQLLAPYFIEGIDTIGVNSEESFELKFKNNTSKTVQVRLSLDGTDVLTTEQATIEPKGKMFVVKPYATMSLEAWPETMDGGARFIFGKTGASVALHTHGDLSNKGIIAAAVFVEGYVPPPRYLSYFGDIALNSQRIGSTDISKGGTVYNEINDSRFDLMREVSYTPAARAPVCGPAVGAGEMIKQALVNAQGLTQPKFERIIRMRYLWWEELQAKMGKYTVAQQHPSGFNGHPEVLANLKSTPRIERTRVEVAAQRTL